MGSGTCPVTGKTYGPSAPGNITEAVTAPHGHMGMQTLKQNRPARANTTPPAIGGRTN